MTADLRKTPQAKGNELEEEIRQRAYQLYEERGREDGHDAEDWRRAEEEISQKTRTAA